MGPVGTNIRATGSLVSVVQIICRILAASFSGSVLCFVGLTVYAVVVGEALRLLGIPPAGWFGSDYVDPRGAVVSFCGQLCTLGSLYFGVGRAVSLRVRASKWLEGFWLCNPVSTVVGLAAARAMLDAYVPNEYTSAAIWFALVGWPILWHVTSVGLRQATWKRGLTTVLAYCLTLLTLLIVQVHRVYMFE